jgi:acyl-CoA thioester hydrolase
VNAGPTDRKPPFRFAAQTRVGFSDTDAQGIVYYGRYLPYFDLARVEYLRHLGLLKPEPGFDFVMRALAVEYLAPARFDDLLDIFVRISRIGRSSTTWQAAAYRQEDDVLMVTAEQIVVFIDTERRRPAPIPDAFRERVRAIEGDGVLAAA